jgi:endonuclease G
MRADWVKNGASPNGIDWRGDKKTARARKAIIGQDSTTRVWFLEQALAAARSVARIKVSGGTGTGFLIGPETILTNNHVLESANDAKTAVAQFNYRDDPNGDPVDVEEYQLDPDAGFWTNPALDYSIVRVKGQPGNKWGWLSLRHGDLAAVGDSANIVGHPRGEYLQIAIRDNEVKWTSSEFVQYVTDTDYGNSGSPVFSDRWRVVALHHQRVEDPNNPGQWYRNQGVNITAILNDAGSAVP